MSHGRTPRQPGKTRDRSVLLSGPIPLVVDILAKSVASLDKDEAKKSIKTRVVALNTRGSFLSNQVKESISVVDGKQPEDVSKSQWNTKDTGHWTQ